MHFYVAPDGNDRAEGTLERPFATLERAKQAVRGGGTVYLRAGEYPMPDTFSLGTGDSDVTYAAYQGERVSITGGVSLPLDGFYPYGGGKPIPQEAAGKILCCNLKKSGLSEYGQLQAGGFGRDIVPSAMELFVNGRPMTLARWPNEGFIPVGEVVDPGSKPRDGDTTDNGAVIRYDFDRADRWKDARDAMAYGYWHVGYADDSIPIASVDTVRKEIHLAQAHLYGVDAGESFQKYYVYNLLEELDCPGEYYIDREEGILYLYPDEELRRVEVSLLEQPLVAIEQARNVTFEGITFENSRGMGVYIEGGDSVCLLNCTFRNLGTVAVQAGQGVQPYGGPVHNYTGTPASRVTGNIKAHLYDNMDWDRNAGTNHRIKDCTIYNTGTGGVILGGGSRKTLIPGNNAVLNCRIHDVNRRETAYRPAVWVDGVGNLVSHNEIYNLPQMAIHIFGNDQVVEYNEIHHAVTDADDMGAIYAGRNKSEVGNVIRYNFIHHIGMDIPFQPGTAGQQAIFWDDGEGAVTVYGNVFYRVGNSSIFKANGGRFMKFYHNICVDCAAVYERLRDETVNLNVPAFSKEYFSDFDYKRLFLDVDISSELFVKRYPEAKLWRMSTAASNEIRGNLLVNTPLNQDTPWTLRDNCEMDDAGIFTNYEKMDFTIKPKFAEKREFEGVGDIPFHEMGVLQG